jgi:hypothetical protein
MRVHHLEVLVEEPSMEAALQALLPKMLGETSFRTYVHNGKADLLGCLPSRLRGYAAWLPPDYRVVVIVDRDDDGCHDLKARLESIAADAGLTTRSRAPSTDEVQLIARIAIEELEAWYFGDWEAVRAAYARVPKRIPMTRGFRDPDAIVGGTAERFEGVLKSAGYFAGGLRKVEAARAIAEHMDPRRNRSRSFRVLRDALAELVA